MSRRDTDNLPLPAIDPAHFADRQERLRVLAQTFGYDPSRVRLDAGGKTFDYLGQSFTSEGEALPDGSIILYYDPLMSDARMACCLAHEIQHVKYFTVARAYHLEGADGPLHRSFADFTPEKLAAQRGVSPYSNEHWDAWKSDRPPQLFSPELEEGGSEPINETIAEVARALYNWGPDVAINPVWKKLQQSINAACAALDDEDLAGRTFLPPPENRGDDDIKSNQSGAIDHIRPTIDSDHGDDQRRKK